MNITIVQENTDTTKRAIFCLIRFINQAVSLQSHLKFFSASSFPSKSHQMHIQQIWYSEINDTHKHMSQIPPFTSMGWKVLKTFLQFLEITATFNFIFPRSSPPPVAEMWMMNHWTDIPKRIICHLLKLQAMEVGMSAVKHRSDFLFVILIPLKKLEIKCNRNSLVLY